MINIRSSCKNTEKTYLSWCVKLATLSENIRFFLFISNHQLSLEIINYMSDLSSVYVVDGSVRKNEWIKLAKMSEKILKTCILNVCTIQARI